MDLRWQPAPRDSARGERLLLYPVGTGPAAIVAGVPHLVDLSRHVTDARHTHAEMTLTCAFFDELFCGGQPRPGQFIAAVRGVQVLFLAQVEGINDYRNQFGSRSMSFTCRTRDATAAWREVPRITQAYPMGTRIDLIARDVAASVGLQPQEILIGTVGVNTPQSTTQLAQIPAWQMLEQLLLPAQQAPFIDALGRLRGYSRDIRRAPDVVLTPDRVISVSGSKSRPAITRLLLKWRDPNLSMVKQQDRALAAATITAGFFQSVQKQEVYFSEDRTQRAFNTRLVVKQSANSGLIPICTETYETFRDPGNDEVIGGLIRLDTYAYVPALIASFVAIKAAGALPDIAPSGGGPTEPTGKRIHAALELAALLTLASIGTGMYEIWGTPYDYVQGINTTEMVSLNADAWDRRDAELESDFIRDEAHAQAVAFTEFCFRALEGNSYGVTIVDDPRLEIGDIIELPDYNGAGGERMFVTGFSRNLSPGSPAELSLTGFPV